MSAFVVNDEVINKIVAFLSDQTGDNSVNMRGIPIVLSTEKRKAQLGKELFDMNVESVRQRYDEKPECRDYSYQRELPPNPIAAHKHISCLLYQSCEGDVPKTSLYHMMDMISDRIAQHIVHGLPEWEAAPWG